MMQRLVIVKLKNERADNTDPCIYTLVESLLDEKLVMLQLIIKYFEKTLCFRLLQA